MPKSQSRAEIEKARKAGPRVTVVGGTGFLGRRIVDQLDRAGVAVTIAARHPENAPEKTARHPRHTAAKADLAYREELAEAMKDATAVVNCVALYNESGGVTFEDVHVRGARRLAEVAAAEGVGRLVHVSGIGADPNSADAYIRSRGRGEQEVREAMPGAIIVRPSVMFSDTDAFFGQLRPIVRRLPVVPAFGRGNTRLQPVDVEDVAQAVARLAMDPRLNAPVYELGGPEVFTFRRILERVGAKEGRSPVIVPVPFAAWTILARIGERLPSPPITPGQVALMEIDNVVGDGVGTFVDLNIRPKPAEAYGLI